MEPVMIFDPSTGRLERAMQHLENRETQPRNHVDKKVVSNMHFIDYYEICYDTDDKEHVEFSFPLNPYKVLGVPPTASRQDIKQAFRDKINLQSSRQDRTKIAIAYHILTSTRDRYKEEPGNEFCIVDPDHFILAAVGQTKELASRIDKKDILDEQDEHGRTLLYLACKSGFYDTSKLLLTRGAQVNKTQRDGSTALHAAAYYGHKLVVGLLLEHGASTKINNNWGKTALDESRSDEIDKLIQSASKDCITSLTAQLREKGLVSSVRLIEYEGEVIAKELVRDPRCLDASTRAQWDDIRKSWEPVWHGTRYKHLQSILEKGLHPVGHNGIVLPENHVALGTKVFGIGNWAAAIFVSPSLMYSGHAAYAQRVVSESSQWCCLVKALCKPGSYTKHDPTTNQVPVEGEPEQPEYRVPVSEEDKHVLSRVESARNVVVRSVIFVSVRFLESGEIDFEKALKILA